MPADWDEREKIPDPEAVKPEDWDEVIFLDNPMYKLTISHFFFLFTSILYYHSFLK